MSTNYTNKGGFLYINKELPILISSLGGLTACAKIADVTPTQIARWRDGKATPPFFGILALAKAANVSLDSLTNLKGRSLTSFNNNSKHQVLDDYTLIPRFDVEASAGAGAFVDEENKSGEMAFRTDWLKQRRINPDHASVITVLGDSMKPTLETGDSLLVSTDPITHDPIREGIYVINLDDLLMVKRLQKPRRDTINILSDNPAYPPITVTDPAAEKFHIIGRVVWYGRNLA